MGIKIRRTQHVHQSPSCCRRTHAYFKIQHEESCRAVGGYSFTVQALFTAMHPTCQATLQIEAWHNAPCKAHQPGMFATSKNEKAYALKFRIGRKPRHFTYIRGTRRGIPAASKNRRHSPLPPLFTVSSVGTGTTQQFTIAHKRYSQFGGVRVPRPNVFVLDVVPATVHVEPVGRLW